MKLVAPHALTPPQQHPVLTWRHPAVAHLQCTPVGAERQESCHGMRHAVEVIQLLTQQQHAAAFGIDRTLLGKCPDGGQADAALPGGYPWVDAVRALVRPVLTPLLWGIYIVLVAMVLASPSGSTVVLDSLVDDAAFAASAATLWWFGDRAPRARPSMPLDAR